MKFHVLHTRSLSAFASLIPLIASRLFFGANATAPTVWYPTSSSFFMSAALIPRDYNKAHNCYTMNEQESQLK
jgi:hypothetical protein